MEQQQPVNRHKNETENILACLSSAPSNARIIRTAAKMAQAFDCQFTALFVETPDFAVETVENKNRLNENRRLAQELGAKIETVYGEDVPYQIAEFARLSGVTKIVLGRSAAARKNIFSKPPLTEQLLAYAPGIDIHIIPDRIADKKYRPKRALNYSTSLLGADIVKSILILAGATALGMAFYSWHFTNANIIMVYILGVLLTSIATSHQIYSLISSVASVFVFNYFFTAPRFSLAAYETGYPVTFIVMFLTAYITGTFALRYKEQARQSAKIAHRTKILFDTDQMLSRATDKNDIINAAAQQVMELLGRDIVIFENENGTMSRPHIFSPGGDSQRYEPVSEVPVAQWTMNNDRPAGATTDTLSYTRFMYLPLSLNHRVYGVVGIYAKDLPLDATEHSILLSILGECALALENQKNAREKEAAAILAESEQLRANLLRTISHDLRTPLTTISGNASNLLTNADSFDAETKQQIYTDIYDDSIWLTNLVENLLYATRIEEGRMALDTSPQLISELVRGAVNHIGRRADTHHLSAHSDNDLLLVRADARLVMQVIINIIDNALKYTPRGSDITISTTTQGDMALVQIADNGNGIADEDKQKIFDKFYCGSNKIADNRRSIGLGLYLCQAIIQAHGGQIYVTDNSPHGAVFNFTLPLEDTPDYE